MFGIDDAALAIGGVSLASGLVSSAFNASQQAANRNMQVNLANTSHQREVSDLQKAGLNPILSANHGAATPNLQAPQISNPVPDSISSAVQAAQLENVKANTTKTLAEASSAQTAAKLNDQSFWFNLRGMEADSALKLNTVMKSDQEVSTPVLRAYIQSLMDSYSSAHSAAESAKLQIPKQAGQAIPWQILSSAKDAAVNAIPRIKEKMDSDNAEFKRDELKPLPWKGR